MGSATRDVWWTSESGDLPMSSAGLIQTHLNMTVAPLQCNALVAYPVYVLWLNFTQSEKKCMTDHRHVLVVFLLVEAVDLQDRTERRV